MSDGRAVSRRDFLRASAGTAGVAGATGVVTAQEGGGTTTVIVGPGGDTSYDPETVYVSPGSTVRWEWDSDFHNIVVENQPDAADWSGTEGGPSVTYDTGHTYEFTFETLGTYDYFCQPHRQQGMVGSVVVNESGSPPGGDGGGSGPILPESARTLGVAATGAMVSVLGLAYFFMKYGGYDEET